MSCMGKTNNRSSSHANEIFETFLFQPEFYGGKKASEIAYSTAAERKLGQYVRIFPMSYENRACMKVEVFGKPYIGK